MDLLHKVPGDTPCVCGGVAYYHGARWCDDCETCTGFVPAVDPATVPVAS